MMRQTSDEQDFKTSPDTLLMSFSELTFEERADEIASIFVQSLQKGVRAEQERQQQLDAITNHFVERQAASATTSRADVNHTKHALSFFRTHIVVGLFAHSSQALNVADELQTIGVSQISVQVIAKYAKYSV